MSVVCSPVTTGQQPLDSQLTAKPRQPFQLRLILGVPILKENSQFVNDLTRIFSNFLQRLPDDLAELDAGQVNLSRDNLWYHTVFGINNVLKRLEDSALDETSLNVDFALVLLDFSCLNSELGHHLAHLCSSLPYTSLLSVSPPGKLAQLICKPGLSPPKVSCLAIRPILAPYSNNLSSLIDFMTVCSSLTGKPLPLDPSTVDVLPESASLLPLLIPPLSGSLPQPSRLSSLLKSTPKPNSSVLMQKVMDTSKSYLPRPSVRHVPADDWLTYKIDHTKLYKYGPEISKELEEHSLYIHDVADVWALYPRQYQKLETRYPPETPKLTTSKRRKMESSILDDDYVELAPRRSREQRSDRKKPPIRRYDIKSQRRSSPTVFSRLI